MTRPVFIPLAAGLQTELTDQLVTPGATLLLQNCYGQQTGKTQPRGGAGVLSTADQATLPTGGTLPIAWQLATLGGSLVRFNRAPVPLHTWAATPEAWVQPAAATISGTRTYRKGPIKLDTSPVFSGAQAGDQVSDPTMAVSGDVIVYVYEPFGRTAVVIMDRLTRRPIFTRITGASTRCPKVVIVGTMAVVAYQNADGELQVDTYDLTTYTLSDSLDMEDIFVGSAFDIRVGASRGGANDVSVLFREVTTGFLRCAVVDATDLTDNDAYYVCDTAGTPANPDLGFGWMQDFGASGKFSVMFADTTDGLQVLWDLPVPTGGFANAVSLHSLDPSANTAGSGSTPGFRNVIGSTTDSNALGHYRVLYEMTPPGFRTRALTKQVVWDGAAAVADDTIRAVGIRSKLWQHSTSFYFLSAFDGTDQRTYFAIAVSNTLTTGISYAAPLAVAFPRDAGGMTESTNAPSAAAVGPDGEIYVAVTSETRVESIASSGTATGGTSRMLAAEIVRMRHPAVVETEVGPPAEFLRSLFVPGGLLGHFDGSTYAAAGFAYFPPFFTAVAQAGGDLEEDATYRYRIVYSFVDRNGRKWRSAPSTPLTVGTITGEGKFELTIDTLRLIDRGQTNGNFGYQIEVYRTQANADQGFFLVATIFNSPVADTATLVDNVADTALGEQLHTDGNGVENQLLPAISWCVEQNGRLVCGESGTGTVWESVEADFNGGLIFNEALTFDVGDPAEPTTGAAVFGQTLFVFKAGKVYAVDGQGANALGQGSTRTVRLLDVGIGCSNPQSIVVADDGVWFRSSSDRAGIHRTAGGAPQYVGGGVRDQDGLTITGAVVVRSLSQIRFYTEEGTTLVWDWTAKLWSTNTDQPCGTATTGYAGTSGVVYANAVDAYIMAEDAAVFVEGDEAYTAKLRTPWYQTAGIAGWERVKRIQGVGDVVGAHTAVIRLYKNMNETTPFQTVTRDFPTAGVRWDWELRPSQQKYSSLMIEAEITPYQPPDVTVAIEPSGMPEGLVFWVSGDVGVTESGGLLTGPWLDRSGYDQHLNVVPSGYEPTFGVETLDGIPGVSFPLDAGQKQISRAQTMHDRTGNPFGIDPGQTTTRSIFAVVRPLTGPFGIRGGPVLSFRRGGSMFQCVFCYEPDLAPGVFTVYDCNWRYFVPISATPATDPHDVPLLIEWRSEYPDIQSAVNGGADLTLTTNYPIALNHGDCDFGGAAPGFRLGYIDAGIGVGMFMGSIFEVMVFDSVLAGADLSAVRSYFAAKYPSLGM